MAAWLEIRSRQRLPERSGVDVAEAAAAAAAVIQRLTGQEQKRRKQAERRFREFLLVRLEGGWRINNWEMLLLPRTQLPASELVRNGYSLCGEKNLMSDEFPQQLRHKEQKYSASHGMFDRFSCWFFFLHFFFSTQPTNNLPKITRNRNNVVFFIY